MSAIDDFVRSLTPLTIDDLVRLAESSGLNDQLRAALQSNPTPQTGAYGPERIREARTA